MDQTANDNPLMERIEPFRWALEPALGVLFVAAWTLASLRVGGLSELPAIPLFAAAIAVSRLSPVGALVTVALAVLLQAGGLVPVVSTAAWAHPVAGIAVVFAAAAYGNRFLRWIGFAVALLLTIVTSLALIAPVFPFDAQGMPAADLVPALVRIGVAYAVAGPVSILLVGAWVLGLTVNRRAASPEADRRPLEVWLARDDIWASRPAERADPSQGGHSVSPSDASSEAAESHRPGGFRRLRGPQLVVDAAIAFLFCVLALALSTDFPSAGELAVLTIFSVALIFRRSAPPLALTIAWTGALAQMLLGHGVLGGDLAILAVLYATAAYGGRVTRWAGLASAGVGAIGAAAYLSVLQYGPVSLEAFVAPGSIVGAVPNFVTLFVASAAVLGLAWTLGILVRTWRRARLSRSRAVLAIEDQRTAERSVIVEQERNRIARDMHDVVAHSLAVVIAQADGARYARAGNPGAVDTALTTIAATAREALGDVRILLAQLRRDEAAGPQPVLADLARLIEQMRAAGLVISWTETGAPLPLGSGGQLAVYRIVQEALTNALRHGQQDAEVVGSLDWDAISVTATVENAVPTEASGDEPAEVGHGLPGMRERALLAGGTLTVDTSPGRFRVIARVPAAQPAGITPVLVSAAPEGAPA